jgi:hypothetical protein
MLYNVECFKYKLTIACEIEQGNLKQNQDKMKQWYDKDAMIRKFKSGEKVIVLLLAIFFQKRPLTECPKTSSKGLQRRDS